LAGAVAVVAGGGLPVIFGYDIRGKVSRQGQEDQAQIIEIYKREILDLKCKLACLQKGARDGAKDPAL